MAILETEGTKIERSDPISGTDKADVIDLTVTAVPAEVVSDSKMPTGPVEQTINQEQECTTE